MNLVLVVEDEAVIAVAIEQAFEDAGLASDCVGSCAAALTRLTADPDAYRAAVLDVGLPDGRGDKLADGLRAIRPDLPIVLCTAYGLGEIQCDAFGQGRVVVVGKPFVAPQLIEAVRAAEGQAPDEGPKRPVRQTSRLTVLERAFDLAKSGQAGNLLAIRRQLIAEGYLDSRSQLDGPSIQKQLGSLIRAARPYLGSAT